MTSSTEATDQGQSDAWMAAWDWSATPLGCSAGWSPTLTTAAGIVFGASTPACIFWGRDLLLICNRAAAERLATRHPVAMVRPGREVFRQVWETAGPIIEGVLRGAGGRVLEGRLPRDPAATSGDGWFATSLCPIVGAEGAIVGVLAIAIETTERVAAESRQAFTLRLSDALRPVADPATVMATAAELVGRELNVARCGYAEITADAATAVIERDWTDGTMPSAAGSHRISDFGAAFADDYRAARAVIVEDAQADPRLHGREASHHMAQGGMRAHATFPVTKDGRLVAAVFCHHGTPRGWSDADQLLIRDVAERTWEAVERARVEQRLRDSEALLGAVLDQVPVGVGLFAPDGRLIRTNPELSRSVGAVIPSQDIGTDWRAFDPTGEPTPPGDYPGARALRGESSAEVDFVRNGEDGEHWCRVSAVPLMRAGAIIGGVAVVQDVTRRRETENALRTSEERLRLTARVTNDAVMDWDLDDDTIVWNDAYETLFGPAGRPAPEAADRWKQRIHPGDRSRVLADLQGAIDGGAEQWSGEYRYCRADGSYADVFDRCMIFRNAEGTAYRLIGSLLDITKRKQAEAALVESEERLRLAVEVGRLATWDWNITSGDVSWSDEHFRMEGFEVGEVKPSFEAWSAGVHPDDRDGAIAALTRARETRTEYVHVQRSLHPDGTVRWMSARGRFFYDEAGEAVRMIGVMDDVTEQREGAERQGVLVAELQHRTRNLLAVVRSIAGQTMASVGSMEEFKTFFNARLGALSRVQGLLSRSDQEPITIGALVRMELDALGASQFQDRIFVEGPEVPLRHSSVQTMALALHELATNALKYGSLAKSDGSLRVTWQIRRGEDGLKAGLARRHLALEWLEDGIDWQREEKSPTQGGYGRELIERALPYSLGAKTSLTLTDDQVRCTIDLPLKDETSPEGNQE